MRLKYFKHLARESLDQNRFQNHVSNHFSWVAGCFSTLSSGS
jgi:hypothetical protein